MSGMTEHTGYNKLDADFKAKETEQLAKIRAELDATRAAAQAQASKDAHWMCCPKCGGKMVEKKFENVLIDQCASCGGMYFDAGELNLLISHEKSTNAGLLGRLFGR